MCKFSEDSKQKLGNAIVYIASHTQQLSKTKLLKLLYLMEEYMVRRYHRPFLGIPYEVWQAGPVAKDVFVDLSGKPYLLKDFIKTEQIEGHVYVLPIAAFSDDEFSECELEMMDEVLKKYGGKTAKQLVDETHKAGSLWYETAKVHDLLDAFARKECNSSDYRIDFSQVLTPCAAEDYHESLNILQTANNLKTGRNV